MKLWKNGRCRAAKWSVEEFSDRFYENLATCTWTPHPLYSVFTQHDADYYLQRKDEFLHKYQCFYALSKTIGPRRIIELGVAAGASADAYLGGSPDTFYTGIDTFGEPFSPADDSPWRALRKTDDSLWKPLDIAHRLLEDRGFRGYRLITANLRHLHRLPHRADLVIVDAAHDFENEYADLKLALTAEPIFIFIDDADRTQQAWPAIEKFMQEDLRGAIEYTLPIDYLGAGLLIKLKV
jgi:hypothetical protein